MADGTKIAAQGSSKLIEPIVINYCELEYNTTLSMTLT